MDPHDQFCHTPDCSDRGQSGLGNIGIHSRKEQRYCCSTCGRTFAATTGTPFYRLRTATDVGTVVLTLLCHGCPLQAIVAAFGSMNVRWLNGRHGRASTAKRSPGIWSNRAKWSLARCRPMSCGSS